MAKEKKKLFELCLDGYKFCAESISAEEAWRRNLVYSCQRSQWRWVPKTPPKTEERTNGLEKA